MSERANERVRRRGGNGGDAGSGKGKGEGTVELIKKRLEWLKSGGTQLSYRDKLLAPGCGGFLMKHAEDDDIVKGWRSYFHQMNEKDVSGTTGGGEAGVLQFSAEEYTNWCLPWMNSLIIKVLGASFPSYILRDRVNRMWHPRDPLKLIPLSNRYYIVSFSNKEDRDYAFQEGPWMIEDHYLIVQRWRPNFNPWKADLQRKIAAWIRLPDVPFEFYNVESLRRIGNMVGRMIKLDRSTSVYDKGGFARMCVEIDLQQPLLPTYKVFGEERPIVYEGLHQVCFSCGKYGHSKDACPLMLRKDEEGLTENHKDTGDVRNTDVTGRKILRRDFRGTPIKVDIKAELNKADIKADLKQNKVGEIAKVKDQGITKSEWIQVGSKRKNASKGKLKGKEVKSVARVQDHDSRRSQVGPAPKYLQCNSFEPIHGVDISPTKVVDACFADTGIMQTDKHVEAHVMTDNDLGKKNETLTVPPSSSTLGTLKDKQIHNADLQNELDEVMLE
ncbi:hypothetical protein K1719_024060 [Acacia pycnantha]|nr:hypothetical protein K1719_024060 [Acacia pycnantha]